MKFSYYAIPKLLANLRSSPQYPKSQHSRLLICSPGVTMPESNEVDVEMVDDSTSDLHKPDLSTRGGEPKVVEMTDLLAQANDFIVSFDERLARMRELLTNPQETPPRLQPLQILFDDLPLIEDEFDKIVKNMDRCAEYARTLMQKFPIAIMAQEGNIPQMTARLRRDLLAYDEGIEKVKVTFKLSKIKMRMIEREIRKGRYV